MGTTRPFRVVRFLNFAPDDHWGRENHARTPDMFMRLIAVRSDRLKPYRVQCVQRHAYRLCHALRLADCTRLVNQQNASEH